MLLALILLPLVTGLFLLLARPEGSAKTWALIATVLNFAVSVLALNGFNGDGSFNHEMNFAWVPEAGVSFRIGADGISLLMVLLTNLLSPLIVLSSAQRDIAPAARYYGLLLVMVSALNGVFLALDGLLFYIFYELALIPIYFICAIWGGESRIRITLKFFIYTFIGSLFMLAALLYVYLQTPGSHSFRWKT